ncbi:hypothetical protein [Neisseria sp. KEM232]|uniref:hypothetical protein n=1 Tax=Neisseria sp. KEM232 TaxID=655307 RepID=UPI0012FE15D8|nr:hypothetical protein [Neisseria sp. KEM232]
MPSKRKQVRCNTAPKAAIRNVSTFRRPHPFQTASPLSDGLTPFRRPHPFQTASPLSDGLTPFRRPHPFQTASPLSDPIGL